jgi:hypothetical protein
MADIMVHDKEYKTTHINANGRIVRIRAWPVPVAVIKTGLLKLYIMAVHFTERARNEHGRTGLF